MWRTTIAKSLIAGCSMVSDDRLQLVMALLLRTSNSGERRRFGKTQRVSVLQARTNLRFILCFWKSPFTGKKRSLAFTGTGTTLDRGFLKRMADYDLGYKYSRYVQSALNEGYTITKKGMLAWADMPPDHRAPHIRLLLLPWNVR